MRRVYKYPLQLIDSVQKLYVHDVSTPLLFAMQDGMPCLWLEVSTSQTKVEKQVMIVGTGHQVPDGFKHIGSCIDGIFVWHLYGN